MFTCPPAIKAWLCRMYGLQDIPAFGPKADSHMSTLVEKFKVLFSGESRYATIKSSYSGQTSTTSSAIGNRHWLQISLDKNRIQRLETKISAAQDNLEKISDSMEEWVKVKRNLEHELESKMKEVFFQTSFNIYVCKGRI